MSGSIFLASSSYSVGENENTVTITIERTGDLSQPVTVQYGTNPGTAAAGDDFTDSDGSILIPAGVDRVSVSVPIVDDTASESTEDFSFALASVSSGSLLFPRTASISILDDENPVTDPVDPPLQSEFDVSFQNVVSGLSIPMNIVWLPGGENIAFVPEKGGVIKLIDFSTGSVSTALDIAGKVNENSDRGLMDIALHPDLENNPYLYAFYVVDPPETASQSGNAGQDGAGNRFAHVVRYELDMSGSQPAILEQSETILVGAAGQSLSDIAGSGALNYTQAQHENEPASDVDPSTGEYRQDYIKVDSQSHAGGALAFGPDGALYISIGDGTSFNIDDPRTVSVQSVDALAGKILRIDPLTGEGLADNPFVEPNDDLGTNQSKVFQLGLRNPFTMAFSDDGKLFITDTGWYSWEEVNTGEPGANFGWPFYEGGDSGILQPTPLYSQFPDATAFYQAVENGDIEITAPYRGFARGDAAPGYAIQAIVGSSSVYDGSQYPSVFTDDYFFLDVVNGQIFAVDVNDRTQLQYLATMPQNVGALTFSQGPDGYLYYTDFLGTIGRMEITDPNATQNSAPFVANAIDSTEAITGEAFSFALPQGVFFDADGDQLNLQATLSNGTPLPAWLNFNASTGTFSGTPENGDLGSIAVRVTADDGVTGSAQEVFMLNVVQSASPPQLVRPADNQQTNEDQAFSYVLPQDMFIDDDPLQLSATLANGDPLPQWLTFDPATGTFSGTPDDIDVGTIVVTVTATDTTSRSVSDSFAIAVGGQNDAPISSGNPDDNSVTVGNVFSLVLDPGQFTDPDGDDLTLTATLAGGDPLPSWLQFDPATQAFSGTPAQGDVDQLNIVVTATDPSNESATASFSLTVEDQPQGAPFVANPIANQLAPEEAAFSFAVPDNTFDDPDNDPLTYTATLANGDPLPNWLNFDPATQTFSGTPDDPQVGNLQITVTATDPGNASATDTFELDVTAVNDPPELSSPIADQDAQTGNSFSFALPQGTFSDVDDASLQLSATLTNGDPLPSWLTFDPSNGTFDGTPPAGSQGALDISVTATDGSGENVSDEFRLTIEEESTTETLYDDQPNETQYLFGTPENDIFVINGQSADYSWASTQDGLGIVVWGPTGHDLLYDFEAIRFNDLTAPLVQDDPRYDDIPGLTQYLTGSTANDVFVIDGNSGDYNWGSTQDGQGIVVWNSEGHDILYEFEAIEFNDQTVALADGV